MLIFHYDEEGQPKLHVQSLHYLRHVLIMSVCNLDSIIPNNREHIILFSKAKGRHENDNTTLMVRVLTTYRIFRKHKLRP